MCESVPLLLQEALQMSAQSAVLEEVPLEPLQFPSAHQERQVLELGPVHGL